MNVVYLRRMYCFRLFSVFFWGGGGIFQLTLAYCGRRGIVHGQLDFRSNDFRHNVRSVTITNRNSVEHY